MMRAPGFSRRALRIAWRAWRSASAVTAQVLTMMASPRPAALAWPRITSVSKALRRQPKVMSFDSGNGALQLGNVDLAAEALRPAAGHAYVVVGQPLDQQLAAVQHHGRAAPGQLAPRRRDQGRTGAAAAGLRDAGAALPHPHADAVRAEDLRHFDIGALREQAMALQHWAEAGEVDGLRIGNEEHRMRIADIDPDRIAERPDAERQVQGIAGLRNRDLAPVELDRAHID